MEMTFNHKIGFKWLASTLFSLLLFLISCDFVENITPDDPEDLPNVSILNGEWLLVHGNNENANGSFVNIYSGISNMFYPFGPNSN